MEGAILAKFGTALVTAAGRKSKTFWLENQEGARLIRLLQRRAYADAEVDHRVREELAPRLAAALRTDPPAQGALLHLLAGERVKEAQTALAEIVAEQLRDAVDWPEDFTPARYGEIVAAHAVEAVNPVKATDRAAAHADARGILERIDALADTVRPRLPLNPPFTDDGEEGDDDSSTLLTMLRASERRFPLVGREATLDDAVGWLDESAAGGDDHRVMVIHGPGGAGKTRLAGEILARAEDRGWVAGFLRSSEDSADFPWDDLGHPSEPLAIAVDYSEARRVDLARLLEPATVGHSGSAPLRVILLVREDKPGSKTWSAHFGGPVDLGARADRLLADQQVQAVSLVDSLPHTEDRRDLWAAAGRIMGVSSDPPDYLGDPLFERPLFLLLDVQRHLTEETDEGRDATTAPSARILLEGILRHERKYWAQSRREANLDISDARMNQVAIVATLVGGGQRSTFELALAGLPWLKDDELRKEVTRWWATVYWTWEDTVRGVEPDPVGEYLVIHALDDDAGPNEPFGGTLSVDQLVGLVSEGNLAVRQRVLRVLTRIAASSDVDGATVAREVLGRLLSLHLDELLPRAFDPVEDNFAPGGTVGESLVTTVAEAAVAANALSLLGPPSSSANSLDRASSGDPRDVSRDAALQLVRWQVERIATQGVESGSWSTDRYLEMVQWAVTLDLRSGRSDLAARRIADLTAAEAPPAYLAILRFALGQYYAEERKPVAAEEVFHEALADLGQAGENESVLAYVLHHELGLAAEKKHEYDRAAEEFERAEEGKTTLLGPTAEDTMTTSLARAHAEAARDLDRALVLLDDLEGRLDPSTEEFERAVAFRPYLYLGAARAAEAAKDWDRAEGFYVEALEKLGELGGEEIRYLECVVKHDLGDVASGRGDSDAALRLLEEAAAGKARARGSSHSGTLITVDRLTTEIAKTNVDKALERLERTRREVEGEGGDIEALTRLNRCEVTLLTNAGRFDRAIDLERSRLRESGLDSEIRRAILESIGGGVVEPGIDTAGAVTGATLGARVFAPGDPRLAVLASRLAAIVSGAVGMLVMAQMSTDAAWAALPADYDIESRPEYWRTSDESYRDVVASVRKIGSAVPNFQDFAHEGIALVEKKIEAALEDPMITSSLASSAVDIPSGDERATRSWLLHTVLANSLDEERRKQDLATLLIQYAKLAAGEEWSPRLIGRDLVTKSASAVEEALDGDRERLREELERMTGAPPDIAEPFLDAALARALAREARGARERGHRTVAGELFARSTKRLETAGEGDSALTFLNLHELGLIAAEGGHRELAVERFEAALVGEIEHYGSAAQETLATVVHLADEQAKSDVDEAIATVRAARENLDDDHDANSVVGLFSLEMSILSRAGRTDAVLVAARQAAHVHVESVLRRGFRALMAGSTGAEDLPAVVAALFCTIASALVPPDDPKLPCLASVFSEAFSGANGILVIARAGPEGKARFERMDATRRPEVESADDAGPEEPDAPDEVDANEMKAIADQCQGEAISILEDLAPRVSAEPEFAVLAGAWHAFEGTEVDRLRALAENQAMRRWLARMVFLESSDAGPLEGGVAYLLTLYLCLRIGVHPAEAGPGGSGEVWCRDGQEEALRVEEELLLKDLASVGEADPEAVELLLGTAKVLALLKGAEDLADRDRGEDSERLLRLALSELPDSLAESPLERQILEELG